MFEGYEVIALILGLIVLIVILLNWKRLQVLPAQKLLISGFLMFLSSWFFTNLEAILWREALNLLEHISQAFGSLLILVWCWEVFGKTREKR